MYFKPVLTANKTNVPIVAGQFVVDTTEKSIYVDKDNSTRIKIANLVDSYTKTEIDDMIGDIVTLMEEL